MEQEKKLLAVKTFLKHSELSNGIIRVSHGAQFSRGGMIGGWFLMMFILLVSVVFIIQDMLFYALPLILICIPIAAYIADYRGIEIDTNNGKVRSYESFLGYRMGSWYYLKNFNRLKISTDTILEKRALSVDATHRSSTAYDSHRFYTLYLVNDDSDRFIKIYENQSITRVKNFADKFAGMSELEVIKRIGKGETEVIGGLTL